MRQSIAVGLLFVASAALTGCLDETSVDLHEPGEYKGRPDPLVELSGTPEYSAKLQERLRQIQTDR